MKQIDKTNFLQIRNPLQDQIIGQAKNKIWMKIHSLVYLQVYDQAGTQIKRQIIDQIR